MISQIDDRKFSVNTMRLGDQTNYPKKGNTLKVHYEGYYPDGTKFISSRDVGEPFEFTLGRNEVIQGWDEALLMMSLGEKARVICPSQYSYGRKGFAGVMNANQNCIFDVELLSFN